MSLRNSYYWTADYPNMRIDVTYSQTARTGTSATYKVNMAVYFTSSGWHGYGLSAKCTINGTAQTLRIKEPSNSWSGSGHKGTWTFTITASAGASGGTLPASIQLWGTDGDTTNINSGSKTVSLSAWNTAPTWTSDDANINGWKEHKTIPENTGTVTVNLPSASDKEGNTIKYDVYRYINGASNSKIASGTTSRTVSDNIGSFGQGTQIKYLVKCHDGSLWASGDRWSWTYTKNTFTPASISASGSIGYSTTSITLTVSGAKNTNGDTGFGYRLYSPDGLTVFNDSFTPNSSGQVTFSIYSGSGTRPSNPHIDFSELKSFVAKGTYKGTLVLKLQTSNVYGSSGSKEVSIAVDLRTNPVPAGLGNITGAVTVAGGSYFVHNLSTVGISWSGASDRLGAGALTYELQYKYGTGAWTRLTSTTGTSWSGKLPAVTSATTCYFRVIATTTYGYSATSAEKSITMHYYNSPKVSYRSPNRTTSEFTVYIDSSTNTSISAVAISSRTFTGISGSATSFTGSATLIKDTGLTGDSTYNITVKVTDNSGLSNATTTITVPVTTYIPIMSITNKGIAISTTADSAYKLNIGGNLRVAGNTAITGNLQKAGSSQTWLSGARGDGCIINMTSQNGYSPSIRQKTTNGAWAHAVYTNDAYYLTYVTDDNINAGNNSYSAQYVFPANVKGTVYTTGNKPTPADIGAMADGGTYGTIKLNNWIRTIGNTGWYSETHGGGWYMEDNTWLRAYNGKSIYTSANMRFDGNMSTGGLYLAKDWKQGQADCLKIWNQKGYLNIAPQNDGHCHYETDRPNHWFNKEVRVAGEVYAGGNYNQRVYNAGWCGNIQIVATRISNLNTRLASGWYAWSSNATGRPADYGVMLVMQWGSNSDFCQIAVSTGNGMWTRWYVNGGWTNWIAK